MALNKVDRIYEWKSIEYNNFRGSLAKQHRHAVSEFEERTSKTILAFAELGINAEVYWKNKDPRSTVSLVPTSAITGEGIPDMLGMIVKSS